MWYYDEWTIKIKWFFVTRISGTLTWNFLYIFEEVFCQSGSDLRALFYLRPLLPSTPLMFRSGLNVFLIFFILGQCALLFTFSHKGILYYKECIVIIKNSFWVSGEILVFGYPECAGGGTVNSKKRFLEMYVCLCACF